MPPARHTRGQTLVFGAEMAEDDGHYENIAGVMDRHGDLAPIYRQLMPVPFSMWRPGSDDGAIPLLVLAAIGNDRRSQDGLSHLLRAVADLAAAGRAVDKSRCAGWHVERLVGARHEHPAIQRTAMTAWARLFGYPSCCLKTFDSWKGESMNDKNPSIDDKDPPIPRHGRVRRA